MTPSGRSTTYYAVIVAGGSGSRMKSEIPKQFLLLEGRPVLMHTIEAFHSSSLGPQIIVVLNTAHQLHWNELCIQFGFTVPHRLVAGGETRFHSVKNALDLLEDEGIVAIHDAVRPIVDDELLNRCFNGAEHYGTAIPVIESRDSLRAKTSDGRSRAILRKDVLIVQTPQTFKISLLKSAYDREYIDAFTDDASVVESAGREVYLVPGSQKNLKITYPEDLLIASFLLKGHSGVKGKR